MAKESTPSLIWFTIKNGVIITVFVIVMFALLGGAAGLISLISYALQFVGVPKAWAGGLAIITTISLALSVILTLDKIENSNR